MDTTPALITAMYPAASVVDVAEHILKLGGEMEPTRLHALVYLSQAHHLAWSGRPLFDAEIEACAEGPIVPELYELHAGHTTVASGFFYAKRRELASVAAPEDFFHEDLRMAGGMDRVLLGEPEGQRS
jgi:uncharacterized phage-associated protein